jgi:hypothetical protein
MTDKEFAYLSNNVKETSTQILNELFINDDIEKYETKNGNIWKYKAACSCLKQDGVCIYAKVSKTRTTISTYSTCITFIRL